jgi:hypothetical protein
MTRKSKRKLQPGTKNNYRRALTPKKIFLSCYIKDVTCVSNKDTRNALNDAFERQGQEADHGSIGLRSLLERAKAEERLARVVQRFTPHRYAGR